jgi:Ca-activated chloride channel family protein
MLVFDASGSMSGDGWGYGSESANTVPRILKVRAALAKVLPGITRSRRVGLITFGPNQCNVRLELRPTENSASQIMSIVDALIPAGQTPLTAAVAEAAEVLDFREKPVSSQQTVLPRIQAVKPKASALARESGLR